MPSLQKEFAVLANYAQYLGNLVRAKAPAMNQGNGRQPELRIAFGLLDVNVGWLRSFQAEEEKSVARDAEYGRHGTFIITCRI